MPTDCKTELGTPHRRVHARFAVMVFGVALMLTSCSVGPHYKKPVLKINDHWSVTNRPQISTQPATDSAWWKNFNDPALERLIQLAYSQNLPLQVAGVRIMEARAVLDIAIGNQYPQFQQAFASVRGVGFSQNSANKVADFTRYFADDQVGFDVAWEADFWGKYRKAVKADQAGYITSVADYQTALVSLSAEVARTYVIIRTFEELIDQAHRNVTLQQESLRIADVRFRNGATSELDVSQARTLLESTQSSIPQLESSLAQAKNALCTLLGQTTGSVEDLLQGPQVIPAPPQQVAVSIPAEMLRRRPDIRAAELVAMAQSERIGIAKADLYPHFSLTGTVGLHATQSGSQYYNLFSPASLIFAVGPQMYWDFLNYGRIKNQVRVQDARFQEAAITYQNSVLKAEQEVEDGIVGFVKTLEATTAQQNAVAAAQRSAELSSNQYKNGAVDYQRVLDADRELLLQENNLVNLRSSTVTNAISLYKALGGGWEMSVGQPFIAASTQSEMVNRTDWGNLFWTQPATGPYTNSQPPAQK